jgi:hypothetical protein
MNAENFPEIIRDHSRLYPLTYEELRTLVMQYPYCQNLLLLLLKKGYLENHPDWERTLSLVATSIPDRTKLYHWIAEHSQEAILEESAEWAEEVLELKDLRSLGLATESHTTTEEEQTKAKSPVPPSPPEKDAPEPPSPELQALFDFSEEPNNAPPAKEQEQEEVSISPSTVELIPSPDIDYTEAVATIAAGLNAIVYPKRKKKSTAMKQETNKRPRPIPKSSFSSWLQQFQSPQVQLNLENLMETHAVTPPSPPKPTEENAASQALESVEENEEVVTETLALLLERQGHIDRAIAMYKKLSLIFPEKSGFFAQKIKNLSK